MRKQYTSINLFMIAHCADYTTNSAAKAVAVCFIYYRSNVFKIREGISDQCNRLIHRY